MHVYTYTPIGIQWHTHSEKLNTIHSTSVQCSIIRYKQIITCNIFKNKHRYYFQNTGKVHVNEYACIKSCDFLLSFCLILHSFDKESFFFLIFSSGMGCTTPLDRMSPSTCSFITGQTTKSTLVPDLVNNLTTLSATSEPSGKFQSKARGGSCIADSQQTSRQLLINAWTFSPSAA